MINSFKIIFRTISAGLFANDLFGWREVFGGALMLLAGMIEIRLTPKIKLS